jgi:hypothetical protein
MKATINFRGFEFDVQYDYEPAERQTYDYPGYPETFEFWEVELNGIDATYLLEDCFEDFEEEAIKQLKDDNR